MDNLWQQLLPASWQLTLFIFFFVYILRYKQENKFSMQLHVLLKFFYAVILILNAVLFLVEGQRDFLFYATLFMSILTIILMEFTLSAKKQNELDFISAVSCCVLPIFISLLELS
ncbi:DUF1516 domain-containing protein [Priestia megaterium]|uniref:DUF1516 family protein n=1 Tax=Priestia megaterium TaxID=1404 RepID=UPI000D51130C|nr:DUF1516 family protein [Priestia megaterium]PVC72186.1 DUF1516 domain-containing protein [Priestia megaterium]